jgi:hypothetical protein
MNNTFTGNLRVLVFGNRKYIEAKNKLNSYLTSMGIRCISADLDESFKETYAHILSEPKGYGWWIWKPYIILKELNKLQDNEILVYIDSTDWPSREFFEKALAHFDNNDILLVNRGFINGEWTKRDAFVLMDCDNEKYYNALQLEAGVIALKSTQFNIDLMSEWFNFCIDKNIVTDSTNVCGLPNLPGFKDHRHDQSILTNLSIKYDIPSYNFNELIKYNYNHPRDL